MKNKNKKTDKPKMNVAIDKDVHKATKMLCTQSERDIGEYVTNILEIAVRSKILPPKGESNKGLKFILL